MSEVLTLPQSETAIRENEAPAEQSGISPLAVRQQLERVLSSRAFARSPRISRFLGFVVEQTLAGQEDKLKEYLLGVEVFNRTDSFDPRIDSIVRVEARRLRYKLDKYYETEGREDGVHIQFRKGCYVPAFAHKSVADAAKGSVFDFPNLSTIENPHAFALYARGLHHVGSWTAAGLTEGISFLSQALMEDPGCADAHAALASAWTLAAMHGVMSPRDVAAKARRSAAEAVSLRPECPEGNAIQAVIAAVYDFDWNEAENRMRRAIPMDPCRLETRLWYGFCAMLAGRPEDAMREFHKVRQADPTSVTSHLAAGFTCHLSRQHDDALLHYRLAQELAPALYAPHLALGLLFTDQQMHDQAQHELSQASQLSPRNPNVMCALVYAHASAGRNEAARQVLAELCDLAQQQYVPPLAISMAYSALGDRDRAVQKLEEAYDERSPWLALVRTLSAFGPLRDDDRYPALTARIGLT
jgi:tetratricopeptide (TPR) repeat protein